VKTDRFIPNSIVYNKAMVSSYQQGGTTAYRGK